MLKKAQIKALENDVAAINEKLKHLLTQQSTLHADSENYKKKSTT